MDFVLLLGRLLFSIIFILTGFVHFFKDTIDYAAADGVPYAWLIVPLFGILALLGGLSILLGYKARWGAWLIALFLIPVTYFMHDFWTQDDPVMYATQQAMFLKNLAILGGAFIVAYFGSGPYSLDREV